MQGAALDPERSAQDPEGLEQSHRRDPGTVGSIQLLALKGVGRALHPVLVGRHALLLPEDPGEVLRVGKAQLLGNIGDRHIGLLQHVHGIGLS
jgi:hypothetical protein